jgi:hypothetical protein
MYGSVIKSQQFLQDGMWDSLPSATKTKYLTDAARIIDRLNYYSQKKISTQALQFPRTNETIVPVDIEEAAYFIALELAMGFDEEKNAQAITNIQVGKASRGRPRRPDYLVAGVPSYRAWQLLFKYLRTPSVSLERIS